MTVVVKKLVPTTQLTTSATGYGTAVPSGVNQLIKRAVFSNTGAVPHTITVNIVPTSGSPVTGNQVINARTLQAGETYVSSEMAGMVLLPGDQVYALASAGTDVNMTINGLQIS